MDLAYKLEFLTKYACVDSAILHTALRLHLFEHIPIEGESAISLTSLTKHIGGSLRGVRVLTEALVGSNVLAMNEERALALNPRIASALRSPALIERLLLASRWWNPAQQFTTAVRLGTPIQLDQHEWDLLGYYTELFLTETATLSSDDEAEQLFDRAARHFLRTQVLICATEMNLFQHFSEQAFSLAQLAERCSASQRGLKVLLPLLVQFGILQAEEDFYRFSSEAQQLLNRRRIARYTQGWRIAGLFWNALGRLDEVILHERRVLDLQDREQSNQFYLALARYNTIVFPSYLRLASSIATAILQGRPLANAVILDVGAGSGVWGAGFARTEPTTEVVFLDQPQVLPQARRNIEQLGLTKQARFWVGDLLAVDYGHEAFDVIILGQTCHTQNPDNLPGLFDKLAQALRPDGVLVVADFVLNGRRDGPLDYLYFAVKEFISTQGDLLSLEEYTELVTNAGLKMLRSYSQPGIDVMLASRKDILLPEDIPGNTH